MYHYSLRQNFYLYLIVFLLTVNYSLAQDVITLNIKVIDSTTNNPIENVTFVLFDLNKEEIVYSAQSNINGSFPINYKKKCNCQLSLIHEDYQTYTTVFDYNLTQAINIPIIKLKPKRLVNLEEAVVIAKKYTIKKEVGKRIFLPSNELIDLSGSISNLLSYVPAVVVDIEGNVQIRGKEPRIQIDGRSSKLTRAEVLQMLPSDMVQKVEIITSPSASDGTGPRINIITKKNRDKGLNAGINVTVALPLIRRGGVHLTMNKKKGFIYGLYGVNNNSRESTEREFLEDFEDQTISMEQEFSIRDREETSHFGELGYEYNMNKKNRIRGSLSFYNESKDFEYTGVRILEDEQQTINNKQTRNSNDKEQSFSGEIDYKKDFALKGHALKLGLEYGQEKNTEEDLFIETSSNQGDIDDESNSSEENKSTEIELKIKHDYPLLDDIEVSVGYQLDYNMLSQTQRFVDLNSVNDNNIDFLQRVHSTFIEYEHEIGDFEYEIGLRWEFLNRKLDDNLAISTDKNTFTNLLPNLGINYEIDKNNTLSFSFGKRIRYPRLRWLNSFNTNVNLQNIRIGNPDLEPQEDFEFEFEYAKEFNKGTFLISSYATISRDIVQLVTENQNGLTITSPQNIGKGDAFGMEVFLGLNTSSWLQTNLKARGEYGSFTIEQQNTSNNSYNASLIINNFVRLNSYNLELSWIYRSPSVKFQSKTLYSQYFKFGISKKVFKNKGNIVFSTNDPFNTNRRITLINSSDFSYRREFFPNSRRFSLSFFYRFSSKAKFRKTEKRKAEKTILQ